jgi:hypothetical protein
MTQPVSTVATTVTSWTRRRRPRAPATRSMPQLALADREALLRARAALRTSAVRINSM